MSETINIKEFNIGRLFFYKDTFTSRNDKHVGFRVYSDNIVHMGLIVGLWSYRFSIYLER